MTLPQNQEAMPPTLPICVHCGDILVERPAWHRGSIYRWAHVANGLIRRDGHYAATPAAPPDAVSDSRIAEIRKWLEESPNLGREWLKKACIDLLAELDRRKEQR